VRPISIPTLVAPLLLFGCTETGRPGGMTMPGKDAEGADRVTGEDRSEPDAEAMDRDLGDAPPGDTAFADSGEMDAAGDMDAAGMDASTPCSYPPFADPMAVGQGIPPYSWPAAIDLSNGVQIDLDLNQVFCDTDLDIDWGLYDKILIASFPGW
jgi:hypothetical protein